MAAEPLATDYSPLLPSNSVVPSARLEHIRPYHMVLVVMSFLIDFLGVSMPFNIMPMLVDKSSSFHLSGCETMDEGLALSLVLVSHAFGMIISPSIMGKLSDKFGRKPLLLLSMFGISIGYGLMTVTTSYWQFIGYRFLTGLAGGGRPVVSAFVAENARDAEQRTVYLGYIGMVPGFCICVAPSIGGLLATFGLWAPFAVVSLWAAVAFLLLLICLPNRYVPLHNEEHSVSSVSDIDSHYSQTSLASNNINADNNVFIFSMLFSVSTLAMLTIMELGFTSSLVMVHIYHMLPFTMGLTNLGDGIFIVVGTNLFIYFKNKGGYSSCWIAIVGYVLYGITSLLIPFLLPWAFLFFAIKWVILGITSSMFQDALPNIVAELSVESQLGEMMGYLTFSQGLGRLFATIISGPAFFFNPSLPFVTGGIQSLLAALICFYFSRHINVKLNIVRQ